MMDLILSVVLILVCLAFIVKTVFFCIDVCVQAKLSKKTFKTCTKFLQKYGGMFDKMDKMLDSMDE